MSMKEIPMKVQYHPGPRSGFDVIEREDGTLGWTGNVAGDLYKEFDRLRSVNPGMGTHLAMLEAMNTICPPQTVPEPAKVAPDGSRWDSADKALISSYERLTGKRIDVELKLVWQVRLGTGPIDPVAQSSVSPSDALTKVIRAALK